MLFGKAELDGYWEEGYHYYLELKGKKAVLRDYAKRIIFETSVKYDNNAVKKGEQTDIQLGETVLSRTYRGEPMTWIKRLYYDNGEIVMDYYYTIMGDTTYRLHKVDHDPFYNIVVRDKEILPQLQGLWLEWRKDGNYEKRYGVRIAGDMISYGTADYSMFASKFHAVSYRSSPDRIILVPADLTVREFPGMTTFNYNGDMLTSYMIVMDASVPMSVFMREENIGKLPVPAEAMGEVRNTMRCFTDEPKIND
ncbi:MAG: hypothetical protein II135_01225 [Clostridia bacterium]|nr:hypothetical protein [Clostridia bacterium]